jgi:hypothetical protein
LQALFQTSVPDDTHIVMGGFCNQGLARAKVAQQNMSLMLGHRNQESQNISTFRLLSRNEDLEALN